MTPIIPFDSETGAQPDLSTVNSSTSAVRKPRGKPFKRGNRHGKGRPRGSRNKKTLILQELLDNYSTVVVKQLIKKAAEGDPTAMKLFIQRVLPLPRENRMEMELPELRTTADLLSASAAVIEALASGEIPLEQSRAMAELLHAHRSLIVSEEVERRVAALEQGCSTPGNHPAIQIIDPAEDPQTAAAAESDSEPGFSPNPETGAQPDLSTVHFSTSAARKNRGIPFKRGNRLGKGRPRGSRNKKTLILQELLDGYGKIVVKQLIKKAAEGNRTAMKLVIDRVLPLEPENRMEMDLPELRSTADLLSASAAVIEALASGEITVEQSRAMAQLLQSHRKLLVSEELERRVEALEQGRSTPGNVPALQIIDPTEDPQPPPNPTPVANSPEANHAK